MGRPLSLPIAATLLALSIGVSMHGAHAAGNIFTVGKYPIGATAGDAVSAKRQAIARGQQSAFRALMKRLVPVTFYKRIPRLKLAQVDSLIDGFRVVDEQSSLTEYLATMDFSFKPRAVRALLRSYNLPYVDRRAPPLTLIPVAVSGDEAGETGKTEGAGKVTPVRLIQQWRSAWLEQDLKNSLVPLQIKRPVAILNAETVAGLKNGDSSMLALLQQQYRSDRLVVATIRLLEAEKKIAVSLLGEDSVGSLRLERTYHIADGDLQYTAELAAVIAIGVIEGRWKALKAPAVSTAAGLLPVMPVRLTARFSTLGEWQDIKSKLEDVQGIEGLEIGTLSARGAEVFLKFPGGAPALRSAVAQDGLVLSDAGGVWTLEKRY